MADTLEATTYTYMKLHKYTCTVFKSSFKNFELFVETKISRREKRYHCQPYIFYTSVFRSCTVKGLSEISTAFVLTKHTSVEFNPHSNVSIPSSDIDTNKTSSKRSEKTMCDDEVSLLIGWEDLFWYKKEKLWLKKLTLLTTRLKKCDEFDQFSSRAKFFEKQAVLIPF